MTNVHLKKCDVPDEKDGYPCWFYIISGLATTDHHFNLKLIFSQYSVKIAFVFVPISWAHFYSSRKIILLFLWTIHWNWSSKTHNFYFTQDYIVFHLTFNILYTNPPNMCCNKFDPLLFSYNFFYMGHFILAIYIFKKNIIKEHVLCKLKL